jgi:hypothetical protein
MSTPTATPSFLKNNMKTHEVEGGNTDPFVQEDATVHGHHATKNIFDHEEEHSTKLATDMLIDNASSSGPAACTPTLVTHKKTCYLCRKRGHFAKDCSSFALAPNVTPAQPAACARVLSHGPGGRGRCS